MSEVSKSTPAFFRRAFCFLLLLPLLGGRRAASGFPPPARPAQVGKLDPAAARALLEKFRESGIPGQYYLVFELHALPRRGEEKVYRGSLWGAHNDKGAITRVQLSDGSGAPHRWLLQNGASPSV